MNTTTAVLLGVLGVAVAGVVLSNRKPNNNGLTYNYMQQQAPGIAYMHQETAGIAYAHPITGPNAYSTQQASGLL